MTKIPGIAPAALPRSRQRWLGTELVCRAACVVAWVAAAPSDAGAAPPKPSLEDRYFAARDAAIEKFSKLDNAGNLDDAATKAEEAARAGLQAKAHIIVTTQTMFTRWLHAHKDWWDKGVKNVPQQIGAALKDESLYTQAISTDAAVVNFNALPIAKPASAAFAHGMLAGRTQDEIPDAANEVFVSALADGKVYIAYGSIEPEVRIAACTAIRADYNKRVEAAKQNYDKLRQQGEDAYKRCFTRRAPQQPSFAKATSQAQAVLAAALQRQQNL